MHLYHDGKGTMKCGLLTVPALSGTVCHIQDKDMLKTPFDRIVITVASNNYLPKQRVTHQCGVRLFFDSPESMQYADYFSSTAAPVLCTNREQITRLSECGGGDRSATTWICKKRYSFVVVITSDNRVCFLCILCCRPFYLIDEFLATGFAGLVTKEEFMDSLRTNKLTGRLETVPDARMPGNNCKVVKLSDFLKVYEKSLQGQSTPWALGSTMYRTRIHYAISKRHEENGCNLDKSHEEKKRRHDESFTEPNQKKLIMIAGQEKQLVQDVTRRRERWETHVVNT